MVPGWCERDSRAAELRRQELLHRCEQDLPARNDVGRREPRPVRRRTATWAAAAVLGLVLTCAVVVHPMTLAAEDSPVTGETAEEQANAEVARRFFDELHSDGDLAVAEEIVAADAVFHVPGAELVGPAGVGGLVTLLRTAFPDAAFPIADLAVDGDTVVVRWTMTGTSEGEFQGIPPTGEAVTMTGIAYLRIADGLIVEDWVEYDLLGLLSQLGAIPVATEPAGAAQSARNYGPLQSPER